MSGAYVTAGEALATYKDELLLSDGESILSYDEGVDGWTNKGTFVSAYVTKTPVIHTISQQSHADCATDPNGLQAYVYEQDTAVRYSIIDSATGQTVVSSSLLSTTSIKPRVINVGGLFVFYCYNTTSTQLLAAVLPANTPHATLTPVAITSASPSASSINSTNPNYDASVIQTVAGYRIYMAFNNGASGTTVRMYESFAPTTLLAQDTISQISRSIAVFGTASTVDGNNLPVVALTAYSSPNFYAYYRVFSADLSSVIAFNSTATFTSALPEAVMITGCQRPRLDSGFELYYTYLDSATAGITASRLIKTVVNSSFVIESTEEWISTVTLAAKAFLLNDFVYVPCAYDMTDSTVGVEQTGYFVIRSDKAIVGKALPDMAGSPPWRGYTAASRSLLPSVDVLGGSAFRFAVSDQALLSGNGIQSVNGVSSITFDFNEAPYTFNHAELAQNLHFSGGFVQMYDGVGVVEHGFHVYPMLTETLVASGSSGSLSAGTYSYCVTYEWTDHLGNVHRSRPSQVQTVVASATNSVTIYMPYLQLTAKTGTRPAEIVVYRTVADGTILYRASDPQSPTLNVVNGASLAATIVDGVSDAVLSRRPQLYTQFLAGTATGEPYEVQNDPAPPTGLIQLHRNRIWVLDSTNPLQLWYSKEATIGAPVEFNSGFTKQVDPRGGNVTALATIDDKLLVFKQSHIFFIVGQGPLSTGQNNDFSDAILITTDVGCIDQRSVVGTPVGLMFKSRKGIYLIDRGLQVQYIGAPVEAFNDATITSATLVADTNQVRFTLDNNKALVYDYFVQQWGVFTNHNAVDAINWQAQFIYLRPNGQVLVETPGLFSDVGSPYRLKLATSWLSFANVQGFQRVRRAQILGGWLSPHNLLVDVCVDFNDTVIQESTVVPQPTVAYGDSSPYGSESPYGGSFQLYQWRVDLARQKTQSVKFIIQDLPAEPGEGMSLTSLAFEVGAKVGLNKVPATQIVG